MAVGDLRIAGENWVDSATVTASSAVGSLPADRVQDQDLANVWRAGSTTAWLLADLERSREIGLIACIASNAGLTDTARFRVSTADATGVAGDAYDSGTISSAVTALHPRLVHFLEPSVTGRYVRIDFAQAEAPEVGRLVVARTWGPSRHFSFGWESLTRDWSISTMSLGLNLHTDRRRRQEGMRFILNGITSNEYETEVRDLNFVNGTSREILVCRDISLSPLGPVTFWGEMASTARAAQRHPDFFTVEFEIWNRL